MNISRPPETTSDYSSMAGRSRSNSIDVLSDNFETVAALPATSSNAIIGNGTVEENMEGSKSNPFREDVKIQIG